MSRYLVVIERGERGFSAYVPDLPGCIATGRTRRELIRRMQQAIDMHVEALREEGLPVPEPTTDGDWVDVEATAHITPQSGLSTSSARPLPT